MQHRAAPLLRQLLPGNFCVFAQIFTGAVLQVRLLRGRTLLPGRVQCITCQNIVVPCAMLFVACV